MGKIINISPKIVRPTQEYLMKRNFYYVLCFYLMEKYEELGPPIVMAYEDEYFTVDGHHRFAVAEFYKIDALDAYLAESNTDFLRKEDFPDIRRKTIEDAERNICGRFFHAPYLADDVENIGIKTFSDLVDYNREYLFHC